MHMSCLQLDFHLQLVGIDHVELKSLCRKIGKDNCAAYVETATMTLVMICWCQMGLCHA